MDKLLIFTAGMTGAQLEMISKEASFYCIRHGIPAITQEILIQQINTIKYGDKHSDILDVKMYEKTAYREAAHVVVSKLLMPNNEIKQISVIPRNNSNGFIDNNYEELQKNTTIEGIKSRICVSLAGRVAQIKKYGSVDGMDVEASADLKHAINEAHIAITHYGMDKEVRFVNLKGQKHPEDKESTQNQPTRV